MNYSRTHLITDAIRHEGAKLSSQGALTVDSRPHTGRSPNAKYIVRDEITENLVDWEQNQPLSEGDFKSYKGLFLTYATHPYDMPNGGTPLYSQSVLAGHDTDHQLAVRVHTSLAWHGLFASNMFITPTESEIKKISIEHEHFDLYCIPHLLDEPRVLISFKERTILIGGTQYAGEIKKSIFTVMNFLCPQKNMLSMHCSVNTDLDHKNASIFFGLSGTGKTTLSSDESRILIGDDEHVWSDSGLFNIEGGCYAKTINLKEEDEPQIYRASQLYGSILENVVLNGDTTPDFDDISMSQNGRSSYPLEYIKNSSKKGLCGHPNNVIMLTCDAFGVLPPVSKLNPAEAVEQFLLGYTAKVPGTEVGVQEPKMTFSACFGAPFMPLPPKEYAKILENKLKEHEVDCWLVNTGWAGGPYGVGSRMSISLTRKIINSINNGELSQFPTKVHEYTGLSIPQCDILIPNDVLQPELSWDSLSDYKNKLSSLQEEFEKILCPS